MPLCEIDADHVLDELAEIAFAVPGEEGGLPVKVADKLRALEMLYKHLGPGRRGGKQRGWSLWTVKVEERGDRREERGARWKCAEGEDTRCVLARASGDTARRGDRGRGQGRARVR